MLKDFVIVDSAALQAHGRHIDLHNFFELAEIRLNPLSSSVELEFAKKKTVRFADPSDPDKVVIHFSDVDWLELSPGAFAIKSGDIMELGYKEPLDKYHDWLLGEESASHQAHLFFRFENDEFLRVHAKSAKTIVKD